MAESEEEAPQGFALWLPLALLLGAVVILFFLAITLFVPLPPQFVVNGIVVGGIFVLGAIGLSLIYGIKNFANFAHGELMTLGAYVAFVLNAQFAGLEVNIVVAAIVAFVALSLVGVLLEYAIFRRLEGRGVVAALIASFGLFFVLQNLVRIIWGTQVRLYEIPSTLFGLPTIVNIQLLPGVGLTLIQIFTLVVALGLVVFLHLLLKYTKLGKAMRATADNFELAKTTGINTGLVIVWTWVIGAGFAAIGGVLLGLNTQLRPIMGFQVLLFLFAAVILGGIGSAYGALVGGLAIGIANEVSKFYLFQAQQSGIAAIRWLEPAYSPAVAFGVMVVMLIVRPEGLLGGAPLTEDLRRVALRFHRATRRVRDVLTSLGGTGS